MPLIPYKKIKESKREEIIAAFNSRFVSLRDLRKPIADNVEKYEKIYNFDFTDDKAEYTNYIPYVFTIIQTMIAFLIGTMFARNKPVTIEIESGKSIHDARNVEDYINSLLEKVKFKRNVNPMLLNALKNPISWVQLAPVKKGKFFTVEIDILSFFDVYWDTKVKKEFDSDFMVRVVQGHMDVRHDENYYKIPRENIKDTKPPDDVPSIKRREYKVENDQATYYDPESVTNNDDVEIFRWNTRFDLFDEGKLVECIFHFGNRLELLRVETNDMGTIRKTLVFPIVSIAQSDTLLGKSLISIVQNLQKLLNEDFDLQQSHYRLLVKQLFYYDKNADIDYKELHATGGNMIGHDGDPKSLGIFPIPSHLREGQAMIGSNIQIQQQMVGTNDLMMGTALGGTETAREASILAAASQQKFNLYVNNITPYIIDIIKFIVILFNKMDPNSSRVKKYKVKKFVRLTELEIEEDFNFDIALSNAAADIDRKRQQLVNAVNIMAQMIVQTGGDIKAAMKLVFESFDLKPREIEEIMGETPEAKKRAKEQRAMMAALQTQLAQADAGGAPGAVPGAVPGGAVAPQAPQQLDPSQDPGETQGGL